MLWVDRLKLSMGRLLSDFELQCINVKSNPTFPRQHKKVPRCYAFENFFMKLCISIFCKKKQAWFLIPRMWNGLRASRVIICFVNWKTWETFKKRSTSVNNKGRCKLFGQRSETTLWRWVSDALCQPLNYSALTWRIINSTGRHGLYKITRLLTWLWSFILVFSVKKASQCVFSRTWNRLRKYLKFFHPWRYKVNFNCAISQSKKCNLFESSMLLSSSIFVSFLMLQCSCNLTQTLFIRWLWTCAKPRCHNLKKFSQKRCIGGYKIFKKSCLPLVVSWILHMCLETE